METLAAIEREINTLATRNDQLVARLAALEAEQASQWNNLSKLLLCIYQQPKADVVASPTPHPDEHEDSLSSILIKNSFVVSCETAHRKASFSDLPNIEDPRPGDASRPS